MREYRIDNHSCNFEWQLIDRELILGEERGDLLIVLNPVDPMDPHPITVMDGVATCDRQDVYEVITALLSSICVDKHEKHCLPRIAFDAIFDWTHRKINSVQTYHHVRTVCSEYSERSWFVRSDPILIQVARIEWLYSMMVDELGYA